MVQDTARSVGRLEGLPGERARLLTTTRRGSVRQAGGESPRKFFVRSYFHCGHHACRAGGF